MAIDTACLRLAGVRATVSVPVSAFPSPAPRAALCVAMPSTHDHTKVYKNVTPFQPNRGKKIPDKAKTALEQAVSASTAGCCSRCADQVMWKKKYGKFKALTQPRKWCVGGGKKSRRRRRSVLLLRRLTCIHPQQPVRQVHHQGVVPQHVQRRVCRVCVCAGESRHSDSHRGVVLAQNAHAPRACAPSARRRPRPRRQMHRATRRRLRMRWPTRCAWTLS